MSRGDLESMARDMVRRPAPESVPGEGEAGLAAIDAWFALNPDDYGQGLDAITAMHLLARANETMDAPLSPDELVEVIRCAAR